MKLSHCRQGLLCIVALVVLNFANSARGQELIVNGGFESGFSNWTLTPGTFSFPGTDPLFAHTGNGNAFLERTGSVGTMTQSFSTAIGATYNISFWLGNDSGVPPNSFAVNFGPTQVFSITDAPLSSYTFFQFNAVATTATTTLTFSFRHDDDFFRLDDVHVVPEPSTNLLIALSAAGVFGLVQYRNIRRRRQSVRA